ncbi:MAG: MerR family transcriptional regulator [Deltaproteobacteria bacterium]
MTVSQRNHKKLICAKELALLTNVSYAAINNYTDMGLLDIVARRRRVRLYDAAVAKERLLMIVRLIGEGYTLRIIGKLLREDGHAGRF